MWNATGLKSLSDITVAPVVSTILSTHCSQNELHLTPDYCLAPTGNSLQSLFRLLFLLKRIFLFGFIEIITSFTPLVKSFGLFREV